MSSMTPVRVRGKRTATNDEKWHHGKKRKLIPSRTPSERGSSVISSSSEATSSKRRRRKRVDPLLSRLEQLPTEILHTIFEFSCNPDLPLTSPRLASQLGSHHLYLELTSRILQPVLGTQSASKTELANAQRLLNSRFCTWPFFVEWLDSEFNARDMLGEWQRLDELDELAKLLDEELERRPQWTWDRLFPDDSLLPPKKLLKGPFTDGKTRFLNLMMSTFNNMPNQVPPSYRELASEGLKQAVAEGAADALPSFWKLGLNPDTDMLRLAVIHAGCVKEVVRKLANKAMRSSSTDVDFLDPAIWAWADKARARGDEKGSWLIALLKNPPYSWP